MECFIKSKDAGSHESTSLVDPAFIHTGVKQLRLGVALQGNKLFDLRVVLIFQRKHFISCSQELGVSQPDFQMTTGTDEKYKAV